MKQKVTEYIADFLAREGIRDCFMITGGGAMHLNDALGHHPELSCIFPHHEQAAAIAAEGCFRATGKMACVCVTSGPGGTNAITGVMGAWVDSIPMLVLSGQVKRETTIHVCPELSLRQLGDQEFNIITSVRNMTKYAVLVEEPDDIAYHLEKACTLARSGRPGPVWLDLPLDVQGARIETTALRHYRTEDREEPAPGENSFSKETIQTVADRIAGADRPLFLAGTAVRLAGATDLLEQVLEKYRIPAAVAWNANDAVPSDSAFYAGMPGTVGTRMGNAALQSCDLLISLGCRMNIRMIGYTPFDFAKRAEKIAVDIDENELKKPTVKIDFPIHGDVKLFLEELLKADYVSPGTHGKWLAWCHGLQSRYPAVPQHFHRAEEGPVNPYVFIDTLFSCLQAEDRIVCGNGSACVITFQAATIKKGQRIFTNSGSASMGYALPAAVGAAAADEMRRTICIDGDGSIMMNLQELATIAHHRMNIKIFLLNNGGYHSMRQTQKNLFEGAFVGIDEKSGISFPDFEKTAAAFGIAYREILCEPECAGRVQEVLALNGPVLCEVQVDPAQEFEPKIVSRVLPDGRIESPSLDDIGPLYQE